MIPTNSIHPCRSFMPDYIFVVYMYTWLSLLRTCTRFAILLVVDLCVFWPISFGAFGAPLSLVIFQLEQEFAVGFKKTMAFQPRVIKQKLGNQSKECRCHDFRFKTYGWVSLFMLHFYAGKVLYICCISKRWGTVVLLVREFGSSNWRMKTTARLRCSNWQVGRCCCCCCRRHHFRFVSRCFHADLIDTIVYLRPSIKCRILLPSQIKRNSVFTVLYEKCYSLLIFWKVSISIEPING